MTTSWRKCPFVPNESYRVLETFSVPVRHCQFMKGETVRFVYEAYSMYDGASAYFFKDSADAWKVFEVPDHVREEFLDIVNSKFEPVAATG